MGGLRNVAINPLFGEVWESVVLIAADGLRVKSYERIVATADGDEVRRASRGPGTRVYRCEGVTNADGVRIFLEVPEDGTWRHRAEAAEEQLLVARLERDAALELVRGFTARVTALEAGEATVRAGNPSTDTVLDIAARLRGGG